MKRRCDTGHLAERSIVRFVNSLSATRYPATQQWPPEKGTKKMSSRSQGLSPAANQRRVAFATIIGTTIEWYDFFIYATAAGLIFADLFFKPAGSQIGLLLSFATVGLSFLFRPLGAFLAVHFGDRIGRRAMLVLTLLLMGGSTTRIG